MSFKTVFSNPEVTLEDIWGSVVYAYRVNKNEYVSSSRYSQSFDEKRSPNKEHALLALNHTSLITEADRAKGSEMRSHFQGLLFKQLAGSINDFERNMLKIAEKSEVADWKESMYDFSILCSMVKTYDRECTEQKLAETSKHFGTTGERLNMHIRVISSVYSQKWGTNYISAVTGEGNLVFFSFAETMKVGVEKDIAGTVKSHRDGNVTQLNRVKVK